MERMEQMERMTSLVMDTLRKGLISEVKGVIHALECGKHQLLDSVSAAIEEVLHKATKRQQSNQKGPMDYIGFSMLQSNLLLNRYALQVDAWDKRFLIDDNKTASKGDFQTIFQGVKPDMETVAAILCEQMTWVQEYELREMKRAHILNYFAIALEALRVVIPACLHIMRESPAILAPKVQFTVGAHMEQQPFYAWRPEI